MHRVREPGVMHVQTGQACLHASVSNAVMNSLDFWGKAQPIDPDQGPEWHPLPFHCLDVAAVGEVLLNRNQGISSSLSRLLSLPPDQTVGLVSFLLCMHDIGKFAKKFQAKALGHFPKCFPDDPAQIRSYYDHAAGGLRLFRNDPDLFCLPSVTDTRARRAWEPLISAVVGHHGVPPQVPFNDGIATLRRDFGGTGIEAAREFAKSARGLFAVPPAFQPTAQPNMRRASFALAGLAVLADWIGSNQKWFRYCSPDAMSIKDYWERAKKRAETAVKRSGVLPANAAEGVNYDTLIGDHDEISPMQAWAESVEIPSGPTLFIIEDETGSGKTEAALMLAHRLMTADRKEHQADGLYVALPTMATANAMFERLAIAYRHLFATTPIPSIALVHGSRGMHEGFRAAKLEGGRREKGYSGPAGNDNDSDTTASAACAAWIADDRRRSFLADAGVGTVDQALLSILPGRHQSLRLFGLMRRVLILDEMHAYDSYMGREIETLLEFQAGLGGSAILLSATLPVALRKRFADAFVKGLGIDAKASDTPPPVAYPMATVSAADCQSSCGIPAWSKRSRNLPVRFLRSANEALSRVAQAASEGRTVLYVRNTVDDALEAYAHLKERNIEAEVFHARFALADRLRIEESVTRDFGKTSGPRERVGEHGRGKVLIATQVVEQSLDLDFDVLVSDLAPIDLLIQRAGRLWRHNRPDRKGHPELLVVGPEPLKDADSDWFSRALPKAAYVYQDHAKLWLTANTLEQAGAIDSPGELRNLIEAVYGEDAEKSVPDQLMSNLWESQGRAGADRSMAHINSLRLSKGYTRQSGAWDKDFRTPTRMVDDPQVTLRLARLHQGSLRAFAYESALNQPWRAWRLSEVNVSARKINGELVPPHYDAAKQQAKADWTRYDADKILVILEEDPSLDGTLCGLATARERNPVTVTYNSQTGLEVHTVRPEEEVWLSDEVSDV